MSNKSYDKVTSLYILILLVFLLSINILLFNVNIEWRFSQSFIWYCALILIHINIHKNCERSCCTFTKKVKIKSQKWKIWILFPLYSVVYSGIHLYAPRIAGIAPKRIETSNMTNRKVSSSLQPAETSYHQSGHLYITMFCLQVAHSNGWLRTLWWAACAPATGMHQNSLQFCDCL